MKKFLPFGEALVNARRAQGFASAHAFYTGCGGPKSLGVTFAAYLALEHGLSLPKPRRLKALLAALKLLKGSSLRIEFMRAYLDSLFEDPELVAELAAPPASGPRPDGGLLVEASRLVKRNSVNLDLAKWETVARDYDAYLCDYFLQCTSGFIPFEEIAQATGLSAAAVKSAVRRLDRAGMVDVSGDRARSPHTEKLVNIPPLCPATESMYADLRKHRERMIRSGDRMHDSCIVGRISSDALDRYAQYMTEAIDAAAVYCDSGDPSAGIYAVEARIVRVLDSGDKKTRRREGPAAGVWDQSLSI